MLFIHFRISLIQFKGAGGGVGMQSNGEIIYLILRCELFCVCVCGGGGNEENYWKLERGDENKRSLCHINRDCGTMLLLDWADNVFITYILAEI